MVSHLCGCHILSFPPVFMIRQRQHMHHQSNVLYFESSCCLQSCGQLIKQQLWITFYTNTVSMCEKYGLCSTCSCLSTRHSRIGTHTFIYRWQRSVPCSPGSGTGHTVSSSVSNTIVFHAQTWTCLQCDLERRQIPLCLSSEGRRC